MIDLESIAERRASSILAEGTVFLEDISKTFWWELSIKINHQEAWLAQLEEHLTCNQRAVGSIPASSIRVS